MSYAVAVEEIKFLKTTNDKVGFLNFVNYKHLFMLENKEAN